MLTFHQLKKILLFGSLILVSHSQVAYSNTELSFNFGKKFQVGGAFKGGYDLLYRFSINESSSAALGLRLGTLQKNNKVLPDRVNILFNFLTNYRFHVTESFFTGLIFGVDILKIHSISKSIEISNDRNLGLSLTTTEYLWDRFTADIGLEMGYSVTPNVFFKLELGYDLLSFKCIGNIRRLTEDNIRLSSDDSDEECSEKFNGIYATLGIGYHF